MADNDYALGEIVSSVAHSPFADSTLIIAVEDDTWNGFDHVNAFRTAVFIAGPYVKHHAVVSMPYNTVNLVKTILEVFGAESLGINDALARPMYDIFDRSAVNWSYDAVVPDVLRSTKLPLPSTDHARVAIPKHSSQYWSKAMADLDFSGPDRLSSTFRSELWRGFKGNQPYSGAQQPRKTDGDD